MVQTTTEMVNRIFERFGEVYPREAIGIPEVSRKLDVSRKTIVRAIQTGELQAVQVRGQWRIGRDALAEFLDTKGRRRLPKFRRREPIDECGASFPEPIGVDADGEPIPF